MANTNSRVTIHMVASLDGFIARRDGRVDWLETLDKFEDGDTMTPEFVEEFLLDGPETVSARRAEFTLNVALEIVLDAVIFEQRVVHIHQEHDGVGWRHRW